MIMKFDDDDDSNDFFVNDDAETDDRPLSAGDDISFADDAATTPEKPSAGQQRPEPARSRRFRRAVAWVVAVAMVTLGVTFYLRYCNPYVTEARITGYVKAVEKRGMVFRTYEADLISEESLTDTTRVYSGNFTLSVPDDALAKKLQALQGTGRRVTIVYEKYYGTLPWRGASKNVATGLVDGR